MNSTSGPKVIKLFSCGHENILLKLNVKMQTVDWLNNLKHEKSLDSEYFDIYVQFQFHAQLC